MDGTVGLTTDIHVFFSLLSLLLATLNLMLSNMQSDFSKLIKRTRFLLPIYYASLSGIAFTGLVLLGISKFSISFSVTLMFIVWMVVFILTIKLFKHLKRALASKDDMVRTHFIWYMKRKWVTDIVLIVIVTLFAWRIGI